MGFRMDQKNQWKTSQNQKIIMIDVVKSTRSKMCIRVKEWKKAKTKTFMRSGNKSCDLGGLESESLRAMGSSKQSSMFIRVSVLSPAKPEVNKLYNGS